VTKRKDWVSTGNLEFDREMNEMVTKGWLDYDSDTDRFYANDKTKEIEKMFKIVVSSLN